MKNAILFLFLLTSTTFASEPYEFYKAIGDFGTKSYYTPKVMLLLDDSFVEMQDSRRYLKKSAVDVARDSFDAARNEFFRLTGIDFDLVQVRGFKSSEGLQIPNIYDLQKQFPDDFLNALGIDMVVLFAYPYWIRGERWRQGIEDIDSLEYELGEERDYLGLLESGLANGRKSGRRDEEPLELQEARGKLSGISLEIDRIWLSLSLYEDFYLRKESGFEGTERGIAAVMGRHVVIWDTTFAGTRFQNDMTAVVVHELAHSLGAPHSDDPNSYMFPKKPKLSNHDRSFDPETIRLMQATVNAKIFSQSGAYYPDRIPADLLPLLHQEGNAH